MPRPKIVKPSLTDLQEVADDLPDLSPEDMKFVDAILQGKGVAESFEASRDCSRYNRQSIKSAASRLYNKPRIIQWRSAMRRARLAHTVVTVESHISDLMEMQELCIASGNLGAAAKVLELQGKAAGIYVERRMDVTSPDPVRALQTLSERSPRLAAALADVLTARKDSPKLIEVEARVEDYPSDDE